MFDLLHSLIFSITDLSEGAYLAELIFEQHGKGMVTWAQVEDLALSIIYYCNLEILADSVTD